MKKSVIIFCCLILILSISFISSISNVQDFVDGTKVTITYEGTPPFFINIREDANIEQDKGGYLNSITDSNSFTYDMDFANAPSGKFYYSVKDTDWSDVGEFSIQREKSNLSCIDYDATFENPYYVKGNVN